MYLFHSEIILIIIIIIGMAGAVSRTVVSPVERMKILFQVNNNFCFVYIFLIMCVERAKGCRS